MTDEQLAVSNKFVEMENRLEGIEKDILITASSICLLLTGIDALSDSMECLMQKLKDIGDFK